jgi:hypothetical protein
MKDILMYIGLTASPVLLGLVAYFLKDLIHENKSQHTTFETKIALLEENTAKKLTEVSKEVNLELKEQRTKILDVKESITMVDAKQGKLDIVSRQIEEIHKSIDKQNKTYDELEEKIINQKKEVEEFKKNLELTVPEKDYSHILQSEFLSEPEKQAIKEHIDFLKNAPLQGYKLGTFISFIEDKIAKKKHTMVDMGNGWRVSDSLLSGGKNERKS